MAMEKSQAVKIFVDRIKQKYSERRVNHEKQWPPSKSEKLVRLELVEGEQRKGYTAGQTRGRDDEAVKRSPLAYSDILKAKGDKKRVRKVLVEGDAGIGKTTLCTALSEDWANGTCLQDFQILLLLPLRQKRIASACSLVDLLKFLHPSQNICELVAEYVEEEDGKVLIIADGWDELSTKDCSEGSFLYELLLGEVYLLSIIVTSRPSASAPLHHLQCVDRFTEVHGFSKDNIKEFIRCEFANDSDREKGSDLLKQLEDNPLVESVCSVPLNCAIVCHLWHHFEGSLPTTMSELYTKIILNIILRNIWKRPEYSNIPSLSHFNSLPESLQQPWSLLCELAFLTLCRDKIVFSHEDLSLNLYLGSEIFCFGLLQFAESIMMDGHGVSFHFLHLTFQEYLAALYLVRQPTDKQLQICQSHARLQRFKMVWRFFFGISSVVYNRSVDVFVSKVLVDAYYDTLTLCHFAFEANQRSINNLVTSKIKSGGHVKFFTHNTFDSAAVIHVIVNLQDCSNVDIHLSSCCLGDKQIAALTAALAGEYRKLLVRSVDLSGNKLSGQSVADLFNKALPAFNSSLLHIILRSNVHMIGPNAINSITTTLAKSLFQEDNFLYNPTLDLSDTHLEVDGLKALSDAIYASKLKNLVVLTLAGSLASDANINAELILALGSGHCHDIKELDLSKNNLGVPGGKALGKILPHLPSGLCLYLEETMLGDEGISALTQNLRSTCELEYLNLESNNIHAAGVSYLVESVCTGIILLGSSLYLTNNPLGLEGIMNVVKIFYSDHFRVFHIDLSGCQLTTGGSSVTNFDFVNAVNVQQFIFGHQLQANAVNWLLVDNINFTGEGIHILAGFMYMCPSLEGLYCCGCGITSNDLKQLLIQLCGVQLKLSFLTYWDLRDNDIDDGGVSTLIQHLSMFPKFNFDSLDFDGNIRVTSGMTKTLLNLEKLNISHKGNYLMGLEPGVDSSNNSVSTGNENYNGENTSPHMNDSAEVNQSSTDNIGSLGALKDIGDRETTPRSKIFWPTPPPSKGAKDEGEKQLQPTVFDSEETTTTEAETESKCKQEMATSSGISTQIQQLNRVIDFEHGGVSKHLGQIADAMYEWEGVIAEQLELTRADVAAIKTEHSYKLRLQTRAALGMWKQKHGSNATYKNLIEVFERAGYKDLAESVKEMLGCDGAASSQVDSASPQPLVTPPPPLERGASSWRCILL